MSIVESGPKVDNSQEALIRQAAFNSASIALDVMFNRYQTAEGLLSGDQTVTAFIQNPEGNNPFPVNVSWHSPDDPRERRALEELIGKLHDVNLSEDSRDYLEPWQQNLLAKTAVIPGGDLKT